MKDEERKEVECEVVVMEVDKANKIFDATVTSSAGGGASCGSATTTTTSTTETKRRKRIPLVVIRT